MQSVVVTGSGIVVTCETPPLVSMHGKEMRPGRRSVHEIAWSEISVVSMSMIEVPPNNAPWICMTVDLTWGEYIEIHEDADGYAEALATLSRLSGIPTPHRDQLSPATSVTVWAGR